MKKGTRIRAIRNFGGWWGNDPPIPEGTTGVITTDDKMFSPEEAVFLLPSRRGGLGTLAGPVTVSDYEVEPI